MEEQKPEATVEKQGDPKDIEDNKGITFLSYIGILCLIPLLSKKDSAFAQYHAKQGVVLFGLEVISALLVPVAGIGAIGYLIALVFAIIGIVNVSKGAMKPLPLIGSIGEKINL
ncbi:hypothetical protein KKC60_03415 [Patescibacteria group bacterium]|nr:hypothetical protein [Patescibacteria group bacterium]